MNLVPRKKCHSASRVLLALFVIALSIGQLHSQVFASTVKVYRCLNGDEVVIYRQQPCKQGTQQELQIDVKPLGWVKPKVTRSKPARKPKKKRVSKRRTTHSKDRKKEKCWRAEKRLENLEWRMRRGYKAGQGAKLRRRRREYEDYLREFCGS